MKNKNIFITILMILLLSLGVSATSDWVTYGKNNELTNFQDISFTGGTPALEYSSIPVGTLGMQPLANDFDSDGDEELLSFGANFITFISSGDAGISIENDFNLGASIDKQVFAGNIDGDTRPELVVVLDNNKVHTLDYDGTSLNKSINATIPNLLTGFNCYNFSGTFQCYSTNATHLVEYTPNNGTVSYFDLSTPFLWEYGANSMPIISDYDKDGQTEIITGCDKDGNGQGGFCVIDQATKTLDTSFSSDGMVDNIPPADLFGLLSYNLDGAGGSEICATTGTTGVGGDYYLHCYKSDGSTAGTNTINGPTEAGNTPTMPAIAPVIDDSGYYGLCYGGNSGSATTTKTEIECFSWSTGSIVKVVDISYTGSAGSPDLFFDGVQSITTADMNADGFTDILAGNSIFYLNGTGGYYNISNSSIASTSNMIPVDVNDDGFLEACAMGSNLVSCRYSSISNAPPTLTDSFGRNWDNPICNGTTVRFTSQEYDEFDTKPTKVNYYNDIDTESERLKVDCTGNGTLTTGSYSLASPYVECTYNEINNYIATVYLQDAGNTADLTQLETVNIQVVDGTAGFTCNVGSLEIGADSLEVQEGTGVTSNPSTQGMASFLDFFTGGDDNTQIFVGFMLLTLLVVSVGSGMAYLTHSGTVVGIMVGMVGIIGFICLTVIGLFPIWLLVLCLLFLTISAVLVVSFKVGGG